MTSGPRVGALTLNLGVLCHVEQSPAQGDGRGMTASPEQIKATHHQIVLIKTSVGFVIALVPTLKIHKVISELTQVGSNKLRPCSFEGSRKYSLE